LLAVRGAADLPLVLAANTVTGAVEGGNMAKVLRCAEVTGKCPTDEVVRAETEDELLQAVGLHLVEVHGMEGVPPQLVERVRAEARKQ
jgi:predicted small metal-binding protein